MCKKYETNMKIMCKMAKSHLFHIIFIFILYFGPKMAAGPARSGRAWVLARPLLPLWTKNMQKV